MSVPLISSWLSESLEKESKDPRICNSVVFPAPDAPTIETTSPFLISKSTPFKT